MTDQKKCQLGYKAGGVTYTDDGFTANAIEYIKCPEEPAKIADAVQKELEASADLLWQIVSQANITSSRIGYFKFASDPSQPRKERQCEPADVVKFETGIKGSFATLADNDDDGLFDELKISKVQEDKSISVTLISTKDIPADKALSAEKMIDQFAVQGIGQNLSLEEADRFTTHTCQQVRERKPALRTNLK